jgi:hypothetical protein
VPGRRARRGYRPGKTSFGERSAEVMMGKERSVVRSGDPLATSKPGPLRGDPDAATVPPPPVAPGGASSSAPEVGSFTGERAGPGHDELDRRLREQVSANAELNVELRYLQAELKIREEYVHSLEEELEQTGAAIGRLQLTLVEHLAYRDRVSHRAVDGAIETFKRSPALYAILSRMARAVRAYRPAAERS